jgi:hypothetical protein
MYVIDFAINLYLLQNESTNTLLGDNPLLIQILTLLSLKSFIVNVSETKRLLEKVVDENDDWEIISNRGWGSDKISVGKRKLVEEDLRGEITIHKDSGNQLRLTKEAQVLEEWNAMEVEGIDKKVSEKVLYEEKKENVEDLSEAEDLVAKWQQEAETEIQATDFKSIIVSEDLAG